MLIPLLFAALMQISNYTPVTKEMMLNPSPGDWLMMSRTYDEHRFSPLNNGISADGANPASGLARINGVLCGTTLLGGTQGSGTLEGNEESLTTYSDNVTLNNLRHAVRWDSGITQQRLAFDLRTVMADSLLIVPPPLRPSAARLRE